MPFEDQFQLVILILDELSRSGKLTTAIDTDDVWSDRDLKELGSFSLNYAAASYPEDEELV